MIPQSSWEVRLSNSRGVHYFYNTLTQESVWDPPSELTKEQIDALLGASNLGSKPKEVRASHILVKHSGSRRPSSWKEASPTLRSTVPHRARRGSFLFLFLSINLSLTMHPGGPLLFFLFFSVGQPNITRSKEEAIAILRGYQAEIGGSRDKFGALAREHSDCSSHDHDGDLGRFGSGQMQKPFEDAAFGLRVGEISGIVETQSGVHLILRTE